jgi:hypothetical protein
MGHSHCAGIVSESTGYGGRLQAVTGVEVGHLMDVSQASYLKVGWANWQAGWAYLTVYENMVTPQLIPVQQNGSFLFDGRLWQ